MPLIDHAKRIIVKEHDIDAAVAALLKIVMKDPELQAECIRPAVQRAIYEARGHSTAYTKRHNPSVVNANSIGRMSAVVSSAFLDTWMVGSKSLGDLTAVELREQAEHERGQAAARQRCAAFYELLADQTPEGKRVRDALDHDKARRLWETKPKKTRRGLIQRDARQSVATA